jgi:hypothetical protein
MRTTSATIDNHFILSRLHKARPFCSWGGKFEEKIKLTSYRFIFLRNKVQSVNNDLFGYQIMKKGQETKTLNCSDFPS